MCIKVKYCHRVFEWYQEFRERCRALLYEAAAQIGVEITEMGFDPDHVHLTLRWGRVTLSLDKIAKKLKGYTGRKLLDEFPEVKHAHFWGSGLWGDQLYGDSMGRDPEQQRTYARNQALEQKIRSQPPLTDSEKGQVTVAEFTRNTTRL